MLRFTVESALILGADARLASLLVPGIGAWLVVYCRELRLNLVSTRLGAAVLLLAGQSTARQNAQAAARTV